MCNRKIGAKTVHILPHTRLPLKRNRLLLGRPLLVAEYPTTKIRLTGKAGFDKIDNSRLGSQCAYRYSPVGATYAVLFREKVSKNC
jgi:hypothetical protein